MTQSQLEALLGRSLTTVEITNRETYLKIAYESLEELLCTKLCSNDTDRVYNARIGYRTVWIDIVTEVTKVYVDGVEVSSDTYTLMQRDNRNSTWYNSILFDEPFAEESLVTVEADWGFECKPKDLQLLVARLFGSIGAETKTDTRVKSKQTEDFRITYGDATVFDSVMNANQRIINKYSICGIGEISHGEPGNYGYWERFGERHYGLL